MRANSIFGKVAQVSLVAYYMCLPFSGGMLARWLLPDFIMYPEANILLASFLLLAIAPVLTAFLYHAAKNLIQLAAQAKDAIHDAFYRDLDHRAVRSLGSQKS